MTHDSVSLIDLPTEIIAKFISCLAPDNVRTLRHVIVACYKTNYEVLSTIAEQVLSEHRKWLSDKFEKIYIEMRVRRSTDQERLRSNAKSIIGKQYVEDAEILYEADHWSFKTADLDIEKIRICRLAYCEPDTHMDDPKDYDCLSPFRRLNSKNRRQPWNKARLNIEVGFLPHPSPGYPAVPWRGPPLRNNWQFFDGICIGIEWG